MATLALAWVLRRAEVASAITGTSRLALAGQGAVGHPTDQRYCINSISLRLIPDES